MNQLHNPIDSQSFTSATSVIALHCSGAGAAQWRKLGETLGSRHAFVAPEHYGCDSTGPWSGERAFTLADEAAKTIGIIDASRGKVHLVGHSYGVARGRRTAGADRKPDTLRALGVSSLEDDGHARRARARGDHRYLEAHRRRRDLRRLSRRGSFVRRLLGRTGRMGSAAALGAGCAHALGAESAAGLARAARRTHACKRLHGPACPGADHARPARARPDARDC
ncbi:alpha/beta fold hydrolase [Caballeronia sp. 15711]|uniref:alpha/beta fold hydrolase n=1 Tax=Caballeronia sp. 15711 TaxID=3391029 RepID=UPI0039E2832C